MVKVVRLPAPLGRLLLCSLFIWAGYAKLVKSGSDRPVFRFRRRPGAGFDGMGRHCYRTGRRLAILVGFKTRLVAGILAIWCLITGIAVHLAAGMHSADAMVAYDNMIHFYKNLVMAGGQLYVVAFGAGALSIDNGVRPR